MTKIFCFIMVLCLIPFTSLAWDPSGHKLVAAIAYWHLTPIAKRKIDQITEAGDPGYPPLARFLYISPLPDIWRKTDPSTSNLHYYNKPWSVDDTLIIPALTSNFVTALQSNIKILKDPSASLNQKYVALAWVEHLVADAHQPLHCINRFSKDFPNGDRGGNLFLIKNNNADNLHAFWDQILGKLNSSEIKHLSQLLQVQYPIQYFGNQSNDLDFNAWEDECYRLAKSNVYNGVVPNNKLSNQYQESARETADQQLTLAGYRLAELLNASIS